MRFKGILAVAALALAACTQAPQYSWEQDLQHRLACDFNWTAEQVKEYIQKYIPDVTDEQIAAWTEAGTLESMEIDGQTVYFNRTAPNLFRVDPECKAIKDKAQGNRKVGTYCDFRGTYRQNMVELISQTPLEGHTLGMPVKMKVDYTLTVDADAVPAGEIIRCWLPYPRADVSRQKDIKLLSASEAEYTFSDPDCMHNALYMEKAAVAGQPTVFNEQFEYTSYGEWFALSSEWVAAAAAAAKGIEVTELTDTRSYYDTESELYKKYTAEREKHIIFSERMRALSAQLTAGLENPYDKAKAIFTWVNDNFPWAGAREYSTLENIPEYVLDSGHGDCGQVTLLLLTLCRIAGIPGHFQSGFTMAPGDDGMHDWGELYFEGIGWVPVDQSRGLAECCVRTVPVTTEPGRVPAAYFTPDYTFMSAHEWILNEAMLYFSLGGIDSYRFIANSDYGCAFSPEKKYPRSETVDFQRGEVEWAGGNIYFDQWDYHMDIEYSEAE